jgi:hypothetical protein
MKYISVTIENPAIASAVIGEQMARQQLGLSPFQPVNHRHPLSLFPTRSVANGAGHFAYCVLLRTRFRRCTLNCDTCWA